MKRILVFSLVILLLAQLSACTTTGINAPEVSEEPFTEAPEVSEEPFTEAPEVSEEPFTEAPEVPEEPFTEAPGVPITMDTLIGIWQTEIVYDAELFVQLFGELPTASDRPEPRSPEAREILRSAAEQVEPVRRTVRVEFRSDGTYILLEEDKESVAAVYTWLRSCVTLAAPELMKCQIREESAKMGVTEAEYVALLGYASEDALIEDRTSFVNYSNYVMFPEALTYTTGIIGQRPKPFDLLGGTLRCYEEAPLPDCDYHDELFMEFVLRGDRLCLEGIYWNEDKPYEIGNLLIRNNVFLAVFGHRNVIFQMDDIWNKKNLNDRTMYEYRQYQNHGYLTYVHFGSFLSAKYEAQFGPEYDKQKEYVDDLASIENADTYEQNDSVQEFKAKYEGMGYEIVYLEPQIYKSGRIKPGGRPYLIAVHEGGVGISRPNFQLHSYAFTRAD